MMRLCRRSRHRPSRGQTLVEFMISFPIIALVTFGIMDAGTAVDTESIAGGAVRAGLTAATTSNVAPVTETFIGTAIRNEAGASSGVNLNWGLGQGGGGYNCDIAGNHCGDNSRCAISGNAWWTSGVTGCYSVAYGALTGAAPSTTCDDSSGWGFTTGTAPNYLPSGAAHCVDVLVVIRITPLTPIAAAFGTGGYLYIRSHAVGVQLY